MKSEKLTHIDEHGRARMVDVGGKPESERTAVAKAFVHLKLDTLAAARADDLKKGDLIGTAEIAGLMAAKRTSELIPLCHPIPLTHVEVELEFTEEPSGIEITSRARTRARTGVEMEALTAVAVAALTVYDMIKSLEKAARITDIRLVEKRGGTSGDLILE